MILQTRVAQSEAGKVKMAGLRQETTMTLKWIA
jgi:hypothetical protein